MLNENSQFQWGDFGTALITLPANPGIENTIIGTEQGWQTDPGDDFYDTSMERRFFSPYGKKKLDFFSVMWFKSTTEHYQLFLR